MCKTTAGVHAGYQAGSGVSSQTAIFQAGGRLWHPSDLRLGSTTAVGRRGQPPPCRYGHGGGPGMHTWSYMRGIPRWASCMCGASSSPSAHACCMLAASAHDAAQPPHPHGPAATLSTRMRRRLRTQRQHCAVQSGQGNWVLHGADGERRHCSKCVPDCRGLLSPWPTRPPPNMPVVRLAAAEARLLEFPEQRRLPQRADHRRAAVRSRLAARQGPQGPPGCMEQHRWGGCLPACAVPVHACGWGTHGGAGPRNDARCM